MTDVPTDHPLPDFPLDAPDALLAAAIRRNPGIIAQAQRQAASALKVARAHPDLSAAPNAVWKFLHAPERCGRRLVNQLRVALQAAAVLRALVKLPAGAVHEWGLDFAGGVGGTRLAPYCSLLVCTEARAALASQPELRWLRAQLDAEIVARNVEWGKASVYGWDFAWDLSPAELLQDLRERERPLALNEAGYITMPHGTELSGAEWIAISRHREALVKLLSAEIDPPRPLVVA